MEGTLWKWTNYFSGWQPRWFVLDNGILSYYKSQEDVNNGCKGSIKMAVCDVTVHQSDNTRLDLIIPWEAHFYVKAATPQERQQWLVALGSSKACLSNDGRPSSNSSFTAEDILGIPGDELKAKKSELRLYCDLLMQQVHSVKTAVTSQPCPDVSSLDDATSLLSATCDTFIRTLDECMKLTNADLPKTPTTPNVPSSPSHRSSATGRSSPWNGSSVQRSASLDSNNSVFLQNGIYPDSQIVRGCTPSSSRGASRNQPSTSRSRTGSESSDVSPDLKSVRGGTILRNGDSPMINNTSPLNPLRGSNSMSEVMEESILTNGDGASPNKVPTFISNMSYSFQDIQIQPGGGIPTAAFLDAYKALLPIFDKLNPTAFTPIRLDITANIRKIQLKYSTNPDQFATLQSLILYEVEKRECHHQSSATVALRWLKRGLQFIREFLSEYLSGSEDLLSAANNAYGRTLKNYHGWVVRGVFALAAKSAPSRDEFMQHLAVEPSDTHHAVFLSSLSHDIQAYMAAQDTLICILNDFLGLHDLDIQEQA